MQNIENERAMLNYLERIVNALEERNRHLPQSLAGHKDELPVVTEFVTVTDPLGGPPRVFCKDKAGAKVAAVSVVVRKEMLSHLSGSREDRFDCPTERQVRSADLTGPSC